ncbi:MAG: hypothetical protein ACLFWD_11620 [Anaerolineales bacterium]
MADVHAIFGTLLALGIVFPGMLLAFWLLFPSMTERTKARIQDSPVKCFGTGLLSAVLLAIPITILLAIPFGPIKALGGALLMGALAFAGLGAAGMAGAMGTALRERSRDSMTEASAFVSGAVALELAVAFPVLGWLFLLPIVFIASLGASTLGAIWPRPSKERGAFVATTGELAHEAQSA